MSVNFSPTEFVWLVRGGRLDAGTGNDRFELRKREAAEKLQGCTGLDAVAM